MPPSLSVKSTAFTYAIVTLSDIREFTLGQCGVLAVALHDVTGWPIALVL